MNARNYALRSEQTTTVQSPPTTAKAANTTSASMSTKKRKRFVGVRQRPSGRWVAEIKDTTQKIRMWLGTFETAEEAAHAYDEAARLLRGSNTRTNFSSQACNAATTNNSALACRINKLLTLRKNKKLLDSREDEGNQDSSSSSSPKNENTDVSIASSHIQHLVISKNKVHQKQVYEEKEEIQNRVQPSTLDLNCPEKAKQLPAVMMMPGATESSSSSEIGDDYGFFFQNSEYIWPQFDFGLDCMNINDIPVLEHEIPTVEDLAKPMMMPFESSSSNSSRSEFGFPETFWRHDAEIQSIQAPTNNSSSEMWNSSTLMVRENDSSNPPGPPGEALWDLSPLCPLSCRT